ncbi:MAG: CaiB/BaiF CoA transferase family protein [Oligoflexus sp.]
MLSSFCDLKILDFTSLLPGPFATMILADLGAEVVKIESASRPDMTRGLPPFQKEKSALHAFLNRSKQSLSLDLKNPEAKEIILRLLAQYDIIVEGFRPGVMTKLGLDYDSLRTVNPRLIYCSISGYGQTGPLRERAGHDINYLALSGLASYSGSKETGPVLMGTQVADIAGGSYHAVMGILAAYIHRLKTDEGQHIDISMTDCATSMNALSAAMFLAGGKEPAIASELLNGGSAYDFYRTKDDRFFAVGSLEPQFFMAFLEVMGLTEHAASYASGKAESIRRVKEKAQEIFLSKSFAEWREIFHRLDACVEPVLTLGEALQSPLAQARNLIVEVQDEAGRSFRQLRTPIQFSQAQDFQAKAGEDLGQSSEKLLQEAGYSTSEIAQLRCNRVIS